MKATPHLSRFGNSGQMYTGTEAIIEDALIVFAIFLCITAVVAVLSANMSQSGWLWWIWGLITTILASLVVGAFLNAQIACMIIASALYLIFAWGGLRRKLFASFRNGVITIAVIAAATIIVWLFF